MSIQHLREQAAALSKELNHMLADAGDVIWSAEKQAEFDEKATLMDRARAQIEALNKAAQDSVDRNFSDVDAFRKTGKEKTAEAVAFDTFLRKSFKEMSAEEVISIRNTMSTTTGSQGGYTVPSIIASDLIELLKSYRFMRAVASQITTSQGQPLSYPTSDGTSETGEWVAQNTTAIAADPTFGTVALNVFKASSKIVAVPIELLQDSAIDIQAMVFKRLSDRIGRISNVGFTTGGGTTDPFGVITQSGTGKTGTTGQTLTVIYDDLVDLIDSLDVAYLDVPTGTAEAPGVAPGFMFNQATRRVIRKIKDTTGRPIWTPSYEEGMKAGTPDTLLGYPVYINNDVASMAANAKSIAFGNFQRYVIRDAMETTMFRFDDSAYMKLGQVGFLAWARTGGNLLDTNAVKLYVNSAT